MPSQFNISTLATTGWLTASVSLPGGFLMEDFADDQDGFNIEEMEVMGIAKTFNGQLVGWSKGNSSIYKVTVNIIATSPTDLVLGQLLAANTPSYGKLPANDVITLVLSIPGKVPSTYSNGFLTNGIPSYSADAEGRIKTKSYTFQFNDYLGA